MAQTKFDPESNGSSATDRVLEAPGALALPQFDSLPATAGLSNTEAFRLSVRHALTLLPAMMSRIDDRTCAVAFERFSIR